jgi:hypothetical protein
LIIKDYQDGKLITLSNYFEERGKYLFLVYALAFIYAGVLCLRFIIKELDFKTINTALAICFFLFAGIVLVTFFAAYRFLDRIFTKELIFANSKELKITKKKLFSAKTMIFQISGISNFRHLEAPKISTHQLAGESFDYLGFDTEQKVINQMHGDKYLSFIYNKKYILFGQDIYMWQYEKIKNTINDLSGNDISK